MIDITYEEVYSYLSKKELITIDTEIESKLDYIFNNSKIEDLRNKIWYLKNIFLIKSSFLNIFKLLKFDLEHEKAWNLIETTQLVINNIENNPFLPKEDFNIEYIKETLDKFEVLFPYHLFCSREMLIKKSKCSICGEISSIRNFCGHIPGKVYNGDYCSKIILDADWICIAIVENPVDKYSIMTPENKEYDYSCINTLIKNLDNPYEKFTLKKHKIYVNKPKQKRNDPCWCQSGKKYKKCHLEKDTIGTHYELIFYKPVIPEKLKIINTYK